MRRLAQRKADRSVLRIAVLGCSIGAEVYSILWAIRSASPHLKIALCAVNISKEALDFARNGIYAAAASKFVGAPIFKRLTVVQNREIFNFEGDWAKVEP